MVFSYFYFVYSTLIYIFDLIFGRLLIAALVVSVLIAFLSALRSKISPGLRSWLWIICFFCLLLPFERASLLMFGNLQSVVYEFCKSFKLMLSLVFHIADINLLISHVGPALYAAGFVFFALRFTVEQRKTWRMIQKQTLSCCASYFHKFRSLIYTPRDFQTAYTQKEQAILLSHEKQHIIQHDPVLYRVLAVLQCVFWFCPVLHRGVRLFKQDRELLCDERVMKQFSAEDYGLLLLKAVQMQKVSSPAVGIAPKGGNISERIGACIIPVQENKKAVLAGIGIAAVFLALSVPGFFSILRTISDTPFADTYPGSMDVYILQSSVAASTTTEYTLLIESLKSFMHIQEKGITFDQQLMYDHAISAGFSPDDVIGVRYLKSFRPAWTLYSVSIENAVFTIEDIQNKPFIPFTIAFSDRLLDFIHWVL